jgi:hypothetical protein
MLLRGGVCFALAVLVFTQVRQAVPVYFLWLVTVASYAAFQGRFALMPALHQPERYHATANILLVLDLATYAAVVFLCRVGWFGIVLLAFMYFCSGKFAGYLATRRAAKDVLRILVEHEPDMSAEERVRVAHIMLEQRRRAFQQGKSIR